MSRPSLSHVSLRALAAAVAGALLAGLLYVLVGAAPAHAATPRPRVPAGMPSAIEPMTQYVGQVSCDPTLRHGTVALAKLLAGTYRSYGGSTWMSTYSCGTDGTRSEHYDGRAIDWMVGTRNAKQHAAATSAISWLLATDSQGHRFAMARRLGIMYLIYNNRIWGSWDGRWAQYNGCYKLKSRAYDNSCHRTHLHISLSWNGALGRTTFWQKRISPTNYGPCRPRDLNWAYRYTTANYRGCASYPSVHAKSSASAVQKSLVTWSGAAVRYGSHGPAVSVVQRAFHRPQTGNFGATLTRQVKSFQARHHLPATGSMNPRTWRALLAATR